MHNSNERYYLDECEGGGHILIDWDELDPPEGSPGAVEIPHTEVFAQIYERYGCPPAVARRGIVRRK